ncbi:MAG: glutaredoxin family protein [Sinobacteraceae bacterium]|nr:glutaredoxin family protein [Nevskiaceae bacterium]
MTGRLTLLTREGCGLCEEFALELHDLRSRLALPELETRDVDSDPEWLRRFGHQIPVLLWDGVPIAVTRLDAGEIERLFRVR